LPGRIDKALSQEAGISGISFRTHRNGLLDLVYYRNPGD
jgi:hypothetical protein